MQDLFTITKTVKELKSVLIGAKVNRVIEPCDDEVIFTLYNGKVFNLILSASAKYCRIGLTLLEKQSPLTAPNFCMLLRKYLLGGEIVSVETLPCDRVVALSIKNENDFKENNEYILYLEIMGKYSNVFLTQNGVILGSLKTTPQTLDGKRIVMTGSIYAPPKSQGKYDILNKQKSIEVLIFFSKCFLEKL